MQTLATLLLLVVPLCALPFFPPPPKHVPNYSELHMGRLVRYDAPEKASASIILLHGLSGTSDTFADFPPRYHSQERFKHINFVFPNAPLRYQPWAVSWAGNATIPSWFNTTGSLDSPNEDDYWEITDYIHELVLNETKRGIPAERIVVGGFSQGGMVALGALDGMRTKIGGWLFFSSRVHHITRLDANLVFDNKNTPVFHGHGLNDTSVPVTDGISTAERFQRLGFNYHLHLYNGMHHQVDWEPNDRDVEEWVAKIIPKSTQLFGWWPW